MEKQRTYDSTEQKDQIPVKAASETVTRENHNLQILARTITKEIFDILPGSSFHFYMAIENMGNSIRAGVENILADYLEDRLRKILDSRS